jgi:hypothetical protein
MKIEIQLTVQEKEALKEDLGQKVKGNKEWAEYVGEKNAIAKATAYDKIYKAIFG